VQTIGASGSGCACDHHIFVYATCSNSRAFLELLFSFRSAGELLLGQLFFVGNIVVCGEQLQAQGSFWRSQGRLVNVGKIPDSYCLKRGVAMEKTGAWLRFLGMSYGGRSVDTVFSSICGFTCTMLKRSKGCGNL
jgi:hypothetical protein